MPSISEHQTQYVGELCRLSDRITVVMKLPVLLIADNTTEEGRQALVAAALELDRLIRAITNRPDYTV